MKTFFSYLVSVLLFYVSLTANAAQGDIHSVQKVGHYSIDDINRYASNLYPESFLVEPKSGVSFYKVIYETIDPHQHSTIASGLVIVPDSSSAPCPILSYQHWTEIMRTRAPSFFKDGDEVNVALYFGSQGYVVVIADYLGLGSSTIFQPYLHADSEAWATADLLRAVKKQLSKNKFPLNGQLFLTGYSQGGHVTMALHRHLEKDLSNEFKVSASAPMSGPYDLGSSMKNVLDHPTAYGSFEFLFVLQSMHEVYGNIYSTLNQVVLSPSPEKLFNLFSGQYSLPDIVKVIPKTPRQCMTSTFLSDLENNPDNDLAVDLKMNSVYDWKPLAPIRLYHGKADTEVSYHNSEVARDRMTALGGNVELINLGDKVDHASGSMLGLQLARQWFETLRTK